MKYDQFEELCHREWKPETGQCGDVTALSLTDDSLRELAADRFGKKSRGTVSLLQNPITRSDVTVAVAPPGEPATATVEYVHWSDGGSEKRTRTVPISPAEGAPA
jgi:hypothetical protein